MPRHADHEQNPLDKRPKRPGDEREDPGRAGEWNEIDTTVRGRTEKGSSPPRGDPFIRKSACAHRYAGNAGCSCCIEACGYGAILEADPVPQVEPERCTGCGSCIAACPSGAVSFSALPADRREKGQASLEEHLRRFAARPRPIIVFHGGRQRPAMVQGVSPEAVYDAPVQAPGRVGMETFLSAVALGAVLVFVIPEEEAGGVSLSVTGEQVRWSRLLLDALGCRQMLVRMLAPGTRRIALQPTLITPFRPGGAPGAAADFSMPKRAIILRALRQLGGSREAPVGYEAGMPVKAPFGGLFINPQKCSLCMACAGVCTAEALQGISGIEPGLAFSESACIQCGLCAKVCPEGALETVSRFDLQALLGGSAKTLHTAPAHCCPVCGDRYGSPALIDRIRQKLSEHWMYRGAKGREMLSMCTRCRIQYGREHPGTWEKE